PLRGGRYDGTRTRRRIRRTSVILARFWEGAAMKTPASRFRTAAKLVLILLLGFGAFGAPAQAQVMRQDGMTLPWFHTRSEKMARQACADNLPECRDSVRQKMVVEQIITLLAPWVALALILLIGSMYLRVRDRMREKRRHEAERVH